MNIQQKVLQMTAKLKEKESQKATQETAVDPYIEIQKTLTDEQKRLILKYFPRLVNILTQKEEDIYNLCKRFDFNEKVLDDHVNVIIIKSKEHSSEFGAWVEVTPRMKLSFPNKDDKAKKSTAEVPKKEEKTKEPQDEKETSEFKKTSKGSSRRYYKEDYYYQENQEENQDNYRSSRRSRYLNGYSDDYYNNKKYSHSQGRPQKDRYYNDDQEENYTRAQKFQKIQKREYVKWETKSPEPKGKTIVEYVVKSESIGLPEKETATDENIQDTKTYQKKVKRSKGDVVKYYVKKQDTEGSTTQQQEITEHTKAHQYEGQHKTAMYHRSEASETAKGNSYQEKPAANHSHHHANEREHSPKDYKQLLKKRIEENEEEERRKLDKQQKQTTHQQPQHQQQHHTQPQQHHHQDHHQTKQYHQEQKHQQHQHVQEKEKYEKEFEKMEKDRQAERDRSDKLEREIQIEKERREKIEKERQIEKERLQKDLERERERHQAELARVEQEGKKSDKRKNFAVQQISHYTPKNVNQVQVSTSLNKSETTTYTIKPEQEGPKFTTQTQSQTLQQAQPTPILFQSGLQTQMPTQQPTQQTQPVMMQAPTFPFNPYYPFFPQFQMQPDMKDMQMMSPMQMPFIVIPQSNGTSVIQPLYNMPNMTQQATTSLPTNLTPTTSTTQNSMINQTQNQKNILPYNQSEQQTAYPRNQPINSIYGNPTEEANITKSRSMPNQPQNSFFNVNDKQLENNTIKTSQMPFPTGSGYFSMNLNQPQYYDPRMQMPFFKQGDPTNKTQ